MLIFAFYVTQNNNQGLKPYVVHAQVYFFQSANTYTPTLRHTNTHKQIHTQTNTFMRTTAQTHTLTHTHKYTQIHKYTHTHTNTQSHTHLRGREGIRDQRLLRYLHRLDCSGRCPGDTRLPRSQTSTPDEVEPPLDHGFISGWRWEKEKKEEHTFTKSCIQNNIITL